MVPVEFLEALGSCGIEYTENEPMCNHTTFKIGADADVFIRVKSVSELSFVIKTAKRLDVPYFILGKGSNLLVSDNGIEGAVISLSGLDIIEVQNEKIICSAGANLAHVCIAARDNQLSGLEFAFGIPGSVGGALFMNAGAYGGEMSQVVCEAECVDSNGNITVITAEDMALGYRTSAFRQNGLIITSVTLQLKRGEREAIDAEMQELLGRRKDKQPLEYPSAGSTFKRPVGNFAGTLIEKNGLKGVSVGGAEVSVKHAGFVINKGDATCRDVLTLIEKIKDTVYKNDGISLETEVIFVGRAM